MKNLFILAGILFSVHAFANEPTQDTVLFSIDGDEVTTSEFRYVYEKSNLKKDDAYTKASLEEYLNLYINFKLKVKEARTLKYDTIPTVINELAKYKEQLSKSYLNDKEISDQLINEAYERLKYDVHASHILISCAQDASPEDTLAAYRKAKKVLRRLTKTKDAFDRVALETSDDPSVKKNDGNLGYFTALQMVYPFENAAFNTEKGEISDIFRTRFGYHVMKVHDKRPSRGKIRVAHIFAKVPKDANDAAKEAAKAKINSVYKKFEEGESFETLAARFSDDKGSSQKGGVIRWFGSGEMVTEFEEAAFALENNGDVSKPILSPFGYHIIKRIDHQGLAPLNEIKKDLKKKVKRDSRSNIAHRLLVDRIQKDYNFTENAEAKSHFTSIMDSSIYKTQWAPDTTDDMSATLFTIGDKTYIEDDLAAYIVRLRRVNRKLNLEQLFNKYYQDFVDQECIKYEETQLPVKYPEFRALLQEYDDGILLFEITDDMVWNKAVEDTAGLEKFYETVKSYYMWEERMESTIYTCNDSATAVGVKKHVSKKKVKPAEWLLKKFNPEGDKVLLSIETDNFEKGDNKFVDDTNWSFGLAPEVKLANGSTVFVINHKKVAPVAKELHENRGQAISEYQGHLEKEWLASLKNKYKVEINTDVFKGLMQ